LGKPDHLKHEQPLSAHFPINPEFRLQCLRVALAGVHSRNAQQVLERRSERLLQFRVEEWHERGLGNDQGFLAVYHYYQDNH
jgi:hypothetical protein